MDIQVSLVTTCRNEINNVQDWISDIVAQTYMADEVVIVDAESTDGTLQILQQWQKRDGRVKLITHKSTPAAGRNKAIEESMFNIIASTDMGCRLEPHWLENLVAPFTIDNSVEIVAGNYSVDKKRIHTISGWADYVDNDGYRIDPSSAAFLPSNRSVAFTKHIWKSLGKFPEDLRFAGDDLVFFLLAKRRNVKTGVAEQAVCYWERHANFRGFWKEKRVYGYAIGEAGLCETRLMKIKYNSLYSISVLVYSFVKTACSLFAGISKSVRHRRFFILPAIGFLVYGNNINFYFGQRHGSNQGAKTAFACRSRLKTASSETSPDPLNP